MYSDPVLGALLRHSMRLRLDPPPEEVPLPPIDVAALRELSGRAPAEAPRPGYIETLVPLRRAA
ncbi:hypothetical protein Rumeso_00349 [Rubellimicrobium mesophilum DSM 19309]|uniref:Uncharacterized protein n=1 Tax=Rubellimicrobium mesophilum DSM 19309 TaxID=442562 RepID=A0A017HU60_9RHOB|nr:hypothetical protein [Rubellimicrobium mesophilum]EYD78012.1 hypothetical protein Rumeso_00349 [Rubellimicrobium mesophilum DSM 19309]